MVKFRIVAALKLESLDPTRAGGPCVSTSDLEKGGEFGRALVSWRARLRFIGERCPVPRVN